MAKVESIDVRMHDRNLLLLVSSIVAKSIKTDTTLNTMKIFVYFGRGEDRFEG